MFLFPRAVRWDFCCCTLHWVLSGIMAIEVKRTEQRQTSTGSKSQRVVQVTKFDMHAKQLLKQQASKTRHDNVCQGQRRGRAGRATDNTAGSGSTPMASVCGTTHVNARNVKSTTYKHNVQAQRVTSQHKPKITTKIQARHKTTLPQPTTSTQALHVTDQRKLTSTTETEAQHNSS